MIAVMGGLGAATLWALSTLSSTKSTRLIGAACVLSWIMIIGLGIDVAIIFIARTPLSADSSTLAWMAASGIGNMLAMLLLFSALRVGKVGLVAPVASTEGAIAAAVALAVGEVLPVAGVAFMMVVVVGLLLAAYAPTIRGATTAHRNPAIALAFGAAVAGGISIYATGLISSTVALPWALLPPRLAGVLLLAIPLATLGRLKMSRAAAPFIIASACAELGGFAFFTIAARESIAIAAVLGSQFAALAAVGGYFFFKERLVRRQVLGVGLIVLGVAGLSATQI